ncbi:glycosyltransferase N-terminal domain-containing protein [uncultured Rikenella sp.]|uniref:3-deoxy-D-manno-octulosonic acid transferase n=1 Tax=uncultured Rikenella sp. TaxID=368003 RepID=UPI0026176BC1|nr:glycosyltransferase N-terminal domain-containing protein [uncultured Rikenella sp.]
MSFFYDCSIRAFSLGIGVGALFNRKARLLYRGRKGLLNRIEKEEKMADAGRGTIWVHCASLGEFEQGRPLIEELRRRHPVGTPRYRRIVLTFFSPSGYEIRKNYPQADAVYYLPADTPENARRFVAAVRPQTAIFVKYEYWYNYLSALRRFGAKSYVVSAIFRPDTVFFKRSAVGRFMRRTLGLLDHFFVQNETSKELLATIGFGAERVTVSGDTRFDRVATLAGNAPELPAVADFVRNASAPVMVCGSTWPPDEEILLELMRVRPEMKFIVAPHELDSARIDNLIAGSGRKGVRYTHLADTSCPEAEWRDATLLVIDTIGILSGVYRYGQIAYIGGGFGRGIHNTLEAATWGLPVIFGPKYRAFAEAVELVERGAAVSVSDAAELLRTVDDWSSDAAGFAGRGAAAESYVRSRTGATRIILDTIGE